MTVNELLESTQKESAPPAGLSPELQSLWLTKTDNWEAAHKIAQEIDSPMGSWIHAHLHVIEGDLANAAYWYNRAYQYQLFKGAKRRLLFCQTQARKSSKRIIGAPSSRENRRLRRLRPGPGNQFLQHLVRLGPHHSPVTHQKSRNTGDSQVH